MKRNEDNQLVRTGELEWRPLGEEGVSGVHVKSLRYDRAARRSPTILLKFDPGASYPLHDHPGGEEIFVLEGDIKLGRDELRAGDYLFTAAGNKHRVSTRGGCVVLVKVPQQVEIVPARAKREKKRIDEAYKEG